MWKFKHQKSGECLSNDKSATGGGLTADTDDREIFNCEMKQTHENVNATRRQRSAARERLSVEMRKNGGTH